VFERSRTARRGRPAYVLGALALLAPIACGSCLTVVNFAWGEAPNVRLPRLHRVAQGDPPHWHSMKQEDWAGALDTGMPPAIPDPKSNKTPAPKEIEMDSELLATWRVLDDICEPDLFDSESGPAVGCRSAALLPEYAATQICADRSLRFHGDFRVDFDGSGNRQALLLYDGCEGGAANWGGSVLAEQGEEGWRIREHRPGFNYTSCAMLHRANGREALACTIHRRRMGSVYDMVHVVGYEGTWLEAPPLLSDDLDHGCWTYSASNSVPAPSDVYSYEATWRRFDGYEVEHRSDGVHLIVKVSYALVVITPSPEDPVCELIRTEHPASSEPGYSDSMEQLQHLVDIEHIRLDYLDDGERLVPTEATMAALERIQPEGRGSLGLIEQPEDTLEDRE